MPRKAVVPRVPLKKPGPVPVAAAAAPTPKPAETTPAATTSKVDDKKKKKKKKYVPSLSAVVPEGCDGEFCITYIIKRQGHTLGNSLKFILTSYPDVEFCGYTQPHPAEDLIHFRLQTVGTPAQSVFLRAFHDLKSLCEVVSDEFKVELARFKATQPEPAEVDLEPDELDSADEQQAEHVDKTNKSPMDET